MTFESLLIPSLGIVTLGVLVWLWNQRQASVFNNMQTQMNQSSFELQKTLTELGTKINQSTEDRALLLRNEVMRQLQENRVELQTGLRSAAEGFEKRVSGLDQRLETRLQSLNQGVQDKLEKNIKEGFQHFTKVQEHLSAAGKQLEHLNAVGSSINELNSLLKLPHLRGNFGEASLERLLSDMLPANAYELQYQITPNATERVDAIIRYPKHVLPIDSKFPREQILPLFETADPTELELARKNLCDAIKVQAKGIANKYIRPEFGTTDMALLYVPSETLYFEIIRNIKLCEDLAKLKVFAVSPNTLSITLHAISVARDYYDMAKGVEETITQIKRAQKHFENFETRFQEVGKSLKRAQDTFDMATTHLSRYDSVVNRMTGADEEPALPAPVAPSEGHA